MGWSAPKACGECKSVLAHAVWCTQRKGYRQPPVDRMVRATPVAKANIRPRAHAARVADVRSSNDGE